MLCFLPLALYWQEIAFSFHKSFGAGGRQSDQSASDAFNSYKLNLPLFEAVRSNNLELVKSLLEGGVSDKHLKGSKMYYNVNAEDSIGITPIIEATLLGNIELVELLLTHGAKAQPAEGFRHTPLRAACLTANKPLIKLFLEKGADPNAQSEGGRTPLMGACYLRPQFDEKPNRSDLSGEAVRVMLLDPRTDARIQNDFGETALDLCRERKYDKSVPLLRERIQGIPSLKIQAKK